MSSNLSDPNLRNVVEVSILGEDNQSVSHPGSRNPSVHDLGTSTALSRFRHDRREYAGHFRINRNRFQLALNPTGRSQS
jgi:hypothetical protein